jgi:hypothetical protein
MVLHQTATVECVDKRRRHVEAAMKHLDVVISRVLTAIQEAASTLTDVSALVKSVAAESGRHAASA